MGRNKEILPARIAQASYTGEDFENLGKNERYKRLCRKLQDKSIPAQLAFLLSVEPMFLEADSVFLETERPCTDSSIA